MCVAIKIFAKCGFITFIDEGLTIHPSAIGGDGTVGVGLPYLIFPSVSTTRALNQNIESRTIALCF